MLPSAFAYAAGRRQVPIAAEPAHATATALPRLLLGAEPGALVTSEVVAHPGASVPRLASLDLGQGTHLLPEDHGDTIGRALARRLRRI